MKTQFIRIVRSSELVDMIDSVELETENLDPMPNDSYMEGLMSGLNIVRKLITLLEVETIEYDRLSNEEPQA